MAVSTLEKRFKESQGEGVVGAPAAALMADRETEVDFPRDIHPCKSGESVFFFPNEMKILFDLSKSLLVFV